MIAKFFTIVTLVFILAFPKGGIVILGVPISWGYLLLIISSPFLACEHKNCFENLNKIKFLIPFQAVIIYSIIVNGYSSFGYTASIIFSFLFLPTLFLIFPFKFFKRDFFENYIPLIIWILRFIVIFGIVNFIFKILFGKFIDIRGITSIYGADIPLDLKNNNRGGLFKLISTYANGNIYGICVLMMLPFYEFMEKNKKYLWLYKLTILLTLSRTMWFGLILYELFSIDFKSKENLRHRLICLIFIALGVIILSITLNWGVSTIFDSELGGRASQVNQMEFNHFFPSQPFSGIGEMVYIYMIAQFGWLGFITFILAMAGPLVQNIMTYGLKLSGEANAFRLGCLLYLFLCIFDGALQLIPVMAIYWGLIALLSFSAGDSNLQSSIKNRELGSAQ